MRELELARRGLRLPVQGAPDLRGGAGATWRASAQGTHKTKTRGEVSGGGKKLWKQKGTGRARIGEHPQPAVAPRRHGARPACRATTARTSRRARRSNALKLGAVAQAAASEQHRGARRASTLASHKTAELAGDARQARASTGKVAAGRPLRQREPRCWRRATTRRSRPSTRSAVNVYDVVDRPYLVVSEQALGRLVEVLAR